MALDKTTATHKVIEASDINKVAQAPGQEIITDDGRLYYDSTLNKRNVISGNKTVYNTVGNAVVYPGDVVMDTSTNEFRFILSITDTTMFDGFSAPTGSSSTYTYTLNNPLSYQSDVNKDLQSLCRTLIEVMPNSFILQNNSLTWVVEVSINLISNPTEITLKSYKDPKTATGGYIEGRPNVTRAYWDGMRIISDATFGSDGTRTFSHDVYVNDGKLITYKDLSFKFDSTVTGLDALQNKADYTSANVTVSSPNSAYAYKSAIPFFGKYIVWFSDSFQFLRLPVREDDVELDTTASLLLHRKGNPTLVTATGSWKAGTNKGLVFKVDSINGTAVSSSNMLKDEYDFVHVPLVFKEIADSSTTKSADNVYLVGKYTCDQGYVKFKLLTNHGILSEVSDTSTLPVQSKAVVSYIKDKVASVYRIKGSYSASQLADTSGTISFEPGDVVNLSAINSDSAVSSMSSAFKTTISNLSKTLEVIDSSSKLVAILDSNSLDKISALLPVGAELILNAANDIILVTQIAPEEWEADHLPNDATIGSKYAISSVADLLQLISEPYCSIGDNLVWTGDYWDKLSATVDLRNYVTKDDITTVMRYKGTVTARKLTTAIPEIGDTYNMKTAATMISVTVASQNITADLSGTSLTLSDNFVKLFGAYTTDLGSFSSMDSNDTRIGSYVSIGLRAAGSTTTVFYIVTASDYTGSGFTVTPYTEGTTLADGNYSVYSWRVHVLNDWPGMDICWDGRIFQILGGITDLSEYYTIDETDTKFQTKLTIDDTVKNSSTNPVQGKAVDAAIKSAISSVYKIKGSTTVSRINTAVSPMGISPDIGDVYNIVDAGTISQTQGGDSLTPMAAIYDVNNKVVILRLSSGSIDPSALKSFYLTSISGAKAVSALIPISEITVSDSDVNEVTISLATVWSKMSFISENLPTETLYEAVLKDVEVVAGDNIVYTQFGWDKLSGSFDLGGYQKALEFAPNFTDEGASDKVAKVGVTKSYIDKQINDVAVGKGAVVNMVGNGQATLIGTYTFAEATTLKADDIACTINFANPAYKVVVPYNASLSTLFVNAYWNDTELLLQGTTHGPAVAELVDDQFMIQHIYPDSSSGKDTTITTATLPEGFGSTFNSVTYKASQAATIPAGTTIKIYGWPVVQSAGTEAVTLNDMLKQIYETQEAFKASSSIPSTSGVSYNTYTEEAELPANANTGSTACVTGDADTSKRGMYIYVNGKWNKLAFTSETILDNDTVEVELQ